MPARPPFCVSLAPPFSLLPCRISAGPFRICVWGRRGFTDSDLYVLIVLAQIGCRWGRSCPRSQVSSYSNQHVCAFQLLVCDLWIRLRDGVCVVLMQRLGSTWRRCSTTTSSSKCGILVSHSDPIALISYAFFFAGRSHMHSG
jgi:hypothetical protein